MVKKNKQRPSTTRFARRTRYYYDSDEEPEERRPQRNRKLPLSEAQIRLSECNKYLNKRLRISTYYPILNRINASFFAGEVKIEAKNMKKVNTITIFEQLIKMRRLCLKALEKKNQLKGSSSIQSLNLTILEKQVKESVQKYSQKTKQYKQDNDLNNHCRTSLVQCFQRFFNEEVKKQIQRQRPNYSPQLKQGIKGILDNDSFILSWFLVSTDNQKKERVIQFFEQHRSPNARGGANKGNITRILQLLKEDESRNL